MPICTDVEHTRWNWFGQYCYHAGKRPISVSSAVAVPRTYRVLSSNLFSTTQICNYKFKKNLLPPMLAETQVFFIKTNLKTCVRKSLGLVFLSFVPFVTTRIFRGFFFKIKSPAQNTLKTPFRNKLTATIGRNSFPSVTRVLWIQTTRRSGPRRV